LSNNKKIVPSIEFETDSPIPLHFQLSTGIQEYLRKYRCKAGSVLISERALADYLKLSRNTVRKAYINLQEEKVIERRSGGRNIYVTKQFEESYAQQSYPTIGLVMPDKMAWLVSNRNLEVLDYVSGVIDTAGEFGFAATVLPLPPIDESTDKLEDWFDKMRSRLSGLIYLGDRENEYHDEAFQVMLAETSIPQVFMGGKSKVEHVGSVTADVVNGMKMAFEHLLELQHKNIGLIFKQVPKRRYMQLQSFQRYNDALTAIEECGVNFKPQWQVRDFTDKDSLKEQIIRILRQDNRPTAFLCHNDRLAIEAINIIREFGLRVPEDISVVGYDDSYSAAEFNPPLTTIKHPRYLMGKEAVKIIAESRIQHIPVVDLNKVLPANLVIRSSTGLKLSSLSQKIV
jgi:GntR family transcriptional regulator of arabinose operon